MGRYFNRFATNLSSEQINAVIDNFYTMNSFKPYGYKGEAWMKLGKGILVAPQIMRATVQENVVTIEAFVRYAILPGVYLGEFELDDSFFLCVPKKALISKLRSLEMQLGFNPYHQMNMQYSPVPDTQYNNYQNTNNPTNNNQMPFKVCPQCKKNSKIDSAFCMYCGNKF